MAKKMRAAESSDAEVQQLLAQRQAAVMNGDDKAAKAAVKEIDDRLSKLGYTV